MTQGKKMSWAIKSYFKPKKKKKKVSIGMDL